jgi:hypothetical protein
VFETGKCSLKWIWKKTKWPCKLIFKQPSTDRVQWLFFLYRNLDFIEYKLGMKNQASDTVSWESSTEYELEWCSIMLMLILSMGKKSLKLPKWLSESVNRRRKQHNGQKEKGKNRQTTIYKTKDRATRTSLTTRGELSCSRRISSSWSTSGTRCVTLVTNPEINHEWRQDCEVLTSCRTYLW